MARALVYLEENGAVEKGMGKTGQKGTGKESKWDSETTDNFVRGLVDQVKGFISETNVTKVRLKQGDRTLVEIPATVGIVGVGIILFSPLLLLFTAIGAATAMVKEMLFEVEKADGTIETRELKLPAFISKDKEAGKAAGAEAVAEEAKEEE